MLSGGPSHPHKGAGYLFDHFPLVGSKAKSFCEGLLAEGKVWQRT